MYPMVHKVDVSARLNLGFGRALIRRVHDFPHRRIAERLGWRPPWTCPDCWGSRRLVSNDPKHRGGTEKRKSCKQSSRNVARLWQQIRVQKSEPYEEEDPGQSGQPPPLRSRWYLAA